MRRVPVADLRLRTEIKSQVFLLQDKTVRTLRNNVNLLLVTLADRSGSIGGVYHNAPSYVVDSLRDAHGVLVTGTVTEHKQRLQITMSRIEPTEILDAEELMPSARRSLEEMDAELDALIADVEDPNLATLLGNLLIEDKDLAPAFRRGPAAKTYHHACVGGLLEHTLSVARIVLTAADLYPQMDRDMAITVALLHDIGKVRSYDPVTFEFTDEGKMLAHLPIGMAMVSAAIDAIPDFPHELRLRILHAILAHHGDEEKGSPVRPMTLEAIVLHYADNLDGDARGAIDYIARNNVSGGVFTDRSPMHQVAFYLGE